MKKTMNYFMALLLVSAFTFPSMEIVTAATTASVTLTANVSTALNISVSSATASLALIPGAAPATSSSTITATSNDVTGYNISISATNTKATADADLYNTSADSSITAVKNTSVATNGNNWGAYVSSKPVAGTAVIDTRWDGTDTGTSDVAISTSAQRIGYNSATATSGEDWTVTYRAAVDATKESGDYVATITYTIAAGVGS